MFTDQAPCSSRGRRRNGMDKELQSPSDTEILGCRIVSNPKGYPGERTGFLADFAIEV